MKRRARAASLAALLTVVAVTAAWAQPLPVVKPEQVRLSSSRLERLAQTFKAQIERQRFPGAVVLVARKGKIAYFEAFGQRDPATGAKMPKGAIFRFYSMTKPFTSVAAMMLVEDGKLTPADPIAKHLPALPTLQVPVPKPEVDGTMTYTVVPAERPITVQDLLRHTSGFVYANNTPNASVREAYVATRVD